MPAAVRSAFQTSPLDLSTPGFYVHRQAAIEARLADVAAGRGPALLRAAWAAHEGVMCVGVNWERHGARGRLPLLDGRLQPHCIMRPSSRSRGGERRHEKGAWLVHASLPNMVMGPRSRTALFQGREQALSCS